MRAIAIAFAVGLGALVLGFVLQGEVVSPVNRSVPKVRRPPEPKAPGPKHSAASTPPVVIAAPASVAAAASSITTPEPAPQAPVLSPPGFLVTGRLYSRDGRPLAGRVSFTEMVFG